MSVVIIEQVFMDKKTNDLKLVKIAMIGGDDPDAAKKNEEEYNRVVKKLDGLGWVKLSSEEKDWN